MKSKLTYILLLALIIRIGIGIYLGFNSGADFAACGADAVEFERAAWSMAEGNGFRTYEDGPLTAFRAPGYPMFLAALYKVAGGRVFWLNRVALSLVGTATCLLIYLLTLQCGLSRRTGLWAALIMALLPLQFYWCGHFMSEPLASFLNVAMCLLMAKGTEEGTRELTRINTNHLYLFAAGITCGLSILVRPASILVPAVFGMMLCIRMCPLGALRSRRKWFSSFILHPSSLFIVFSVGVMITVGPWTVRNYRVLDRFALVATNGGSTFWGANNDIVSSPGPHWGAWVTTKFDADKKAEVLKLSNEVDQDRLEWEYGKQYVRENIGKMPLLLVGKVYRLLKPFPESSNGIYVLVSGIAQLIMLPLFMAGMIIAFRRKELTHGLLAVNIQLLVLLGTVVIFYGSERFRMPYEPFMAIYAAIAIKEFVKIKKDSPRICTNN